MFYNKADNRPIFVALQLDYKYCSIWFCHETKYPGKCLQKLGWLQVRGLTNENNSVWYQNENHDTHHSKQNERSLNCFFEKEHLKASSKGHFNWIRDTH